jgi:hypothetical protein
MTAEIRALFFSIKRASTDRIKITKLWTLHSCSDHFTFFVFLLNLHMYFCNMFFHVLQFQLINKQIHLFINS